MSISVLQLRRTPRPAAAPAASKGTLAAAGIAAVAAAGLGFAALSSTSAPPPADTTVGVVVVQRTVPRGTLLTGLAGSGALEQVKVPADEVRKGALGSTDAVAGKLAADDLKPGTQLTAASLAADTGSVALRLGDGQRAVSIPLDAAHGMAGDVKDSDRVDLYGSYQLIPEGGGAPEPVVKLIAEDVRVLRAPAKAKSATGAATEITQITVGLEPQTATEVAFTADNGKVWVAARPTDGSPRVTPDLVTTKTLLFGVKPLALGRSPKQAGR